MPANERRRDMVKNIQERDDNSQILRPWLLMLSKRSI
jgi:hypothetical protein